MGMTKHQQKLKELRRRLREDDKFKMESARISIDALLVVSVYMMLEHGWKRKRLTRFILRYSKIIDDLANHKITTGALADHIKSETGLTYNNGIWKDPKNKSIRGL